MPPNYRIVFMLFLWIGVGSHHRVLGEELIDRVEHGRATNPTDNTPIHYVSIGDGPLVVFVHGFPDFWYSWAHQMERLSSDYRCVALDLRGYNRSGKPKALESYDMNLLVEDVVSVIKACGQQRAVVVGHDWGGAIAWTLALQQGEFVDKLVICNLPHPRGLKRELLINDQHRANTQYARNFQDPDYHKQLTAEGLVAMLMGLSQQPWTEKKSRQYVKAFGRSDFQAMLNYYRRNYDAKLEKKPPLPYVDPTPVVKAKMPVLIFHGLQDKALHHHALNNMWEWVEQDLTIVTVPQAGHWVHHDRAEMVSSTMYDWLQRRR